jgi:hypothetical protein
MMAKTDNATSTTNFIGFAEPETATSDPRWLIYRLSKAGSILTVQAAPNEDFSEAWDDRATLFGAAPFDNVNSIEFDGVNDRMSAAHSNDLNFERTDAFSFQHWVKFDTVSTSGFIFAKRDSTANVRGWQSFYNTSVNFGPALILSSTNVGNRIFVVGPTLVTNQWYHILWTYDGSSLAAGVTLYLDGVNTAFTTQENTLTGTIQTTVTTQIGNRDGGSSNFFDGHIDEVAVWNIELNSSQVAEIYNGGVVADLEGLSSAGGLVSWWRMGDGSTYPTIDDESGTNPMSMLNMTNGSIVTDVP